MQKLKEKPQAPNIGYNLCSHLASAFAKAVENFLIFICKWQTTVIFIATFRQTSVSNVAQVLAAKR
jgi:hypothetical protein